MARGKAGVIAFARPGFLLAGALFALVPLALHLLARRRQRPVALPTLRFLDAAERTVLRLRRRPADVGLLTLRMLLPIVLGAGFAGPSWTALRRGTGTIVLLDATAPAAAVDTARSILSESAGALIVFDTAAISFVSERVDEALDSIALVATERTATAPDDGIRVRTGVSYAAAFMALASADRLLPAAESAGVVLITAPRWAGWSDGVVAARAIWPGTMRIVALEVSPTDSAASAPAARGTARVTGEDAVYVRAALGAIGYTIATGDADPADVVVFAGDGTVGGAGSMERVGPSATVVIAGIARSPVADVTLPWRTVAEGIAPVPTPIDLGGGLLVSGASVRTAGEPAEDAETIAFWTDGRPAAAARREGDRCTVYLATRPGGGALPLDPSFPALIDRLARGCDHGTGSNAAGTDDGPLDSGALALLRGTGGESIALTVVTAGDAAGSPLARGAFLLALVIAGMEAWRIYGRRERSR